MTPADLSRLESLAREATPGPWWRPNPNDIGIESENFEIAQTMGLYEREYERMEANAAYIAAANPAAVLALIARVRDAEADAARFNRPPITREAVTAIVTASAKACQRVGGTCQDDPACYCRRTIDALMTLIGDAP